jgi:putative ABC transport system ATP-binding protein
MPDPVLRAVRLGRVFGSGATEVAACTDIDLELHAGELVVITGRSGSGKSTLLNLLGSLDRPTSGSVFLGDLDLATATEAQLVSVRRNDFGFVFQDSGLIPVLSAAENVEIPLRLSGMTPAERENRVVELLDAVGLAGHAEQRPAELSGGQQQRVGIARALASNPRVLLADEPTGQLDGATSAVMMNLILRLVHDSDVAAILTTHDPLLVSRADRVVELHDGRLVEAGHVGRHRAVVD